MSNVFTRVSLLRPEKKKVRRLRPEKKKFQSSVWWDVDYNLKKKSSSRLSGGMSVFGAGDYDRKKKKFQSSVWRVVDYDLKNKSSSHLSGGLSVFGAGDYDRKKKNSSRLSGGL